MFINVIVRIVNNYPWAIPLVFSNIVEKPYARVFAIFYSKNFRKFDKFWPKEKDGKQILGKIYISRKQGKVLAGFHMTSSKFKLKNYQSSWGFTFIKY